MTTKNADPAIPGSEVVATTFNCEVVFAPAGTFDGFTREVSYFYARCTARGCTYVSRSTPSHSVARRWANAHDEDQPNDGRS